MNKIRSSLRCLTHLRTLVAIACLTGLQVALKLVVSIQITETLRISLDYLVHVAVSALFGPAAGVLSGAMADVLGWLVHPTGPFNPGFTLSAMVNGLIYGLMLYERPFSWKRTLLTQALVVIVTNLCLNTLWLQLYYGKAFFAILPLRALKNLLQYPVDAAMMCMLLGQLPRLTRLVRPHAAK